MIAVAWDGTARAVLAVADTVKPTSAQAVAQLRGLGLTPVLLTGDNTAAARAVAAQVGIEEVIAEVLPAGKVDVVKRLQAQDKVANSLRLRNFALQADQQHAVAHMPCRTRQEV